MHIRIPVMIHKNNKGSSSILLAVALTSLVICAALVIDIGMVVFEKSKLSSAVDAASLAGAQELITDSANTEAVVNSYILKNVENMKQVDVAVDLAERTVAVTGTKLVESYFARIMDKDMFEVTATAKAKVENTKSITGARPLSVVSQTFTYGQLYTLKEGAGDGISGNYGAMSLGGTGAPVFRDNMLNGYDGTISVGDMILTETGNMSGTTETCVNQLIHGCNHHPACTHIYYNKNCSRIIFVPIVENLEVNGRDYVKVLGFATFFLEGVTRNSGKADVIGRFITYHADGETSNEINDYGTYGIRLVR